MNESKFRFGQDETDDQFNARVAGNLEAIKHFIDSNFHSHRRFEKRIFFRYFNRKHKKEENDLQRLSAEVRSDTRKLFLMDVKSTLDGVCRRNFNEFLDLEEAYLQGKSFEFHHYLEYNLKEEEKAKEGYHFKTAIGYKLAASWDSDNAGDEMYLRFALPESLILDQDTPEEDVHEWFDSISEVYVEYRKKTDIGYESKNYRISEKGIQKYPSQEKVQAEDFEALTDEQARKNAELEELKIIKILYPMLGQMSIVPTKSTHITP